MNKHLILLLILVVASCQFKDESDQQQTANSVTEPPLFNKVDPVASGIHFKNFIAEDFYHNSLTFDYMYNGAGVAIGDVNNDGLADIFFAGNFADNKLYINEGKFKFKDVSAKAGIEADGSWCSGSSMIDINCDGYLDIYVTRSFPCNPGHTCLTKAPELRRNLLYINDQNGGFVEQAKSYGIDDVGQSIHSSFFDYDNDGDLDLFVTNHPQDTKNHQRQEKWMNPYLAESNKLYRNNGDLTFTDVTVDAGLLDYTYSLGVMAQDLNRDGYVDLYISNDFEEPDLYYVNNGDGTFTNRLVENFKHVSFFGMGIDAGDINNDGYVDLVTLDMLAEDNYREKTQMNPMDPESFWFAVENGYHHQYMRNCLHLNNGNGSFSDIAQFSDIHRTDWSWAPLLADFDNDGYDDLYITNGYRRDSRDKDNNHKITQIMNDPYSVVTPERLKQLLDSIPSTPISNYYYQNQGDYSFSNKTFTSGIDIPSFSNGAAYGDLDNDGDLDLVVNNLMDTAFVFRNTTMERESGNYLIVDLKGGEKNTAGIGTFVLLYSEDIQQIMQHTPSRGYLSSVDPRLHFGCAKKEYIDSVRVIWPDGMMETIVDVKTNQTLTLDKQNASSTTIPDAEPETMFTSLGKDDGAGMFRHQEILFDDYKKQVLLPHKLSQSGPDIAVADVNGDDLDDFYIAGASGQNGALYIQTSNGFKPSNTLELSTNSHIYEETGVHLFDADNDGDNDLYIVSGGNEFPAGDERYADRLFINDGSGSFTISKNSIPQITASGEEVVSADFDNDGDEDLFIGGRHVPGMYPKAPQSYLLENNEGTFKQVAEEIEGLQNIGMVTSAAWVDLYNDEYPELVIAGEWMPVIVFNNEGGILDNVSEKNELENYSGWWSSIDYGDFDNDGDIDLVAGNLGLNYKYKASDEEPFHLYSADFDNNGNLDIVLAFEDGESTYPVRGKQCSSQQIPELKEKFETYSEFGSSDLFDIYGDDLASSQHLKVNSFASSFIENTGNGEFEVHALPNEVQFAPVNDMIVNDFNNDNKLDVLLAGNLYVSEVETGRADAGTGLLLLGNGDGTFKPVPSVDSGFWADKDVKSLELIEIADGSKVVIVGNNNDRIQMYIVN